MGGGLASITLLDGTFVGEGNKLLLLHGVDVTLKGCAATDGAKSRFRWRPRVGVACCVALAAWLHDCKAVAACSLAS